MMVPAAVAAALCSALLTGASAAAGTSAAAVRSAVSGGTWGKAQEVPGLGTLNAGGVAEVVSVSCGSVGNCSAGGFYTDASGGQQAFVVSETQKVPTAAGP
jgi:hypothetical protein